MTGMTEVPARSTASASARRPGRVLPSGSTRSGSSGSRATPRRRSSRSPRPPRCRRPRSSATSRPRRTWSSRTTSTSSRSRRSTQQPPTWARSPRSAARRRPLARTDERRRRSALCRDDAADAQRARDPGAGARRADQDHRRDHGGDRGQDRPQSRRLRQQESGRRHHRRDHGGDDAMARRSGTAAPTWTRCSTGSTLGWLTSRPGCRCNTISTDLSAPDRRPPLWRWHVASRDLSTGLHATCPVPRGRGRGTLGLKLDRLARAQGAAWPAGVLGAYLTWVTMFLTSWTAWVSHLA